MTFVLILCLIAGVFFAAGPKGAGVDGQICPVGLSSSPQARGREPQTGQVQG